MNNKKLEKKLEKELILKSIPKEEKEELLKSRNALLFYKKFRNPKFTYERNGRLWEAIENYCYEGIIPDFKDDDTLMAIFNYIKSDLDYNNNEFLIECKQQYENGIKGGRPQKKYENVLSEISINHLEEKLEKLCDLYKNTFDVNINTNFKTKLGYCLLLNHNDSSLIEFYIQKGLNIEEIIEKTEKSLSKNKETNSLA